MFYYSVSQRKLQPILHSKSASVLHKALRSVLKGQSPRVCAFAPSGADPFRLLTTFAASSPKGTPYGTAGNFFATAKAVPLRDDFPRPGEDVAAGDKKGNLSP